MYRGSRRTRTVLSLFIRVILTRIVTDPFFTNSSIDRQDKGIFHNFAGRSDHSLT
jgi:hypothetical protein